MHGRNVKNISTYNNKLILDLLFTKEYSCTEIANMIGITHVAVIYIIKRLQEAGLIMLSHETEGKRERGRQHIRYTINKDRGILVCVNMIYRMEEFFITDFAGNVLYREQLNNIARHSKYVPDEELEYTAKHIREVADRFNKPVLGVALTIPGQSDDKTGEAFASSRIKADTDLKGIFESALNARMRTRNDTLLSALGEQSLGALKGGGRNTLYVNVGYGLSCCILGNDGKPLGGYRSYFGELGKAYDSKSGKDVHACCAVSSLLEQCEPYLGANNIDELAAAYKKDERVIKTVDESANVLGNTLRTVVAVCGASKVVISGPVKKLGKRYFDIVSERLHETPIEFPVDVYLSRVDFPLNEGLQQLARRIAIDELCSENLSNQ